MIPRAVYTVVLIIVIYIQFIKKLGPRETFLCFTVHIKVAQTRTVTGFQALFQLFAKQFFHE